MNFATFKAKVKAVAFPIGEAENLVDIHNTFITDALIVQADGEPNGRCAKSRCYDHRKEAI